LYSASKKKTARKQPLIQTTDKRSCFLAETIANQLDQLEKRRYTMITSKDETRQDEQANTSKKKAGDFKMF